MTGQGLLFGLIVYVVWTLAMIPLLNRISRILPARPIFSRLATGFFALGIALIFLIVTTSIGPNFGLFGAINLFIHQGLVTLIYFKRRRSQIKAEKINQKEQERHIPFLSPVDNQAIVGIWSLISSYDTMNEVEEYLQDQVERDIVLLIVDPSDMDNLKATTGLKLQINSDGTFSERCFGRPLLEWYNDEGVSTNFPEPFAGNIKHGELGTFIYAQGCTVNENNTYSNYLRYDDGDTVVSDRLSLIKDQLVRTVNVLVDEAYLYRCVYCYQKA